MVLLTRQSPERLTPQCAAALGGGVRWFVGPRLGTRRGTYRPGTVAARTPAPPPPSPTFEPHDPEVVDLLDQLLQKDPGRRLTAGGLLVCGGTPGGGGCRWPGRGVEMDACFRSYPPLFSSASHFDHLTF